MGWRHRRGTRLLVSLPSRTPAHPTLQAELLANLPCVLTRCLSSGVGWERAERGSPWTVAVTSAADLEGCRGVRTALANTGRPFEAVLGGRLPAETAALDVGAAVASAVAVARQYNFSGYNVDDESECAPRSTLANFTAWASFHGAFARGLAAHGLSLSSDIYAAFGITDAPYVSQRPCDGLHRLNCSGCMDRFKPDRRIAQALAAGGDSNSATQWVTMDTYFYTLDHFLNALDWHRSFLPAGRLGVGLINSLRRGDTPDGLPLHNVSAEGWAARAHALHAANISHVSIWSMPLSDEFLWWVPRWKGACRNCGTLACFQPSSECSGVVSGSSASSPRSATLKTDDATSSKLLDLPPRFMWGWTPAYASGYCGGDEMDRTSHIHVECYDHVPLCRGISCEAWTQRWP